MNIGFSGTRAGLTDVQKKSILKLFQKLSQKSQKISLHHGDCFGADEDITTLLVDNKLISRLVIHPPSNISLRAFVGEKFSSRSDIQVEILKEQDYLDKNKSILDISEVLIISPKTEVEELKSGTWATLRAAKKLNKKIIIIYPSGRTEVWPDKSFINKIKKNIKKKKEHNGKEPNTEKQATV